MMEVSLVCDSLELIYINIWQAPLTERVIYLSKLLEST